MIMNRIGLMRLRMPMKIRENKLISRIWGRVGGCHNEVKEFMMKFFCIEHI